MAFNRIKIDNFTVFDSFDLKLCEGINVIIGDNGTGKTHLLKLIYALSDWSGENGKADAYDPVLPMKITSCFQYVPLKELVNRKNKSVGDEDTINISSWINGKEKSYKVYGFSKPGSSQCNGDGVQDYISATFIPSKDMLTHGGIEKDFMDRHLPLDITLIDILNKAGVSTLKKQTEASLSILGKISEVIGGGIVYKNDRYYTERPDGSLIDFASEAEGFKKLGLIYRLIETGRLEKGSVLIWDEPESNLNPKLVPILVDILLELEVSGVQMVFATHDFFFAKYLAVRRQKDNKAIFHAMYRDGNHVRCESSDSFDLLENNSIVTQSITLYKEEVAKVMV